MDLSDINRTRDRRALPLGDAGGVQRWRELVGEVGAEIAGPLTAALDRLESLTRTRRIDRHGLRALRSEIEGARRVGMEAQQLARIASGHVQQTSERIPLTTTLHALLVERAADLKARAVEARPPVPSQVEIAIDPSLLFGLLNTVLDWALDHARSRIDFAVEAKAWPPRARLHCRFAHRPVDRLDDGAATPEELRALDSVHWRLVQQTAWAFGLPLERTVDAAGTALTIDFPRSANDAPGAMSAVEIDVASVRTLDAAPLAGSHVLVVVQRRDVRAQVHGALRHMGLALDFVASVAEAATFCIGAAPHAIVVEAPLLGTPWEQLRRRVASAAPNAVFIELVDASQTFEMAGVNGSSSARVGRDTLAQGLPAALLFELSKSAAG